MLQINNKTPYRAAGAILLDPAGAEVWALSVKATFAIGPNGPLRLAEEQIPVCVGDEYYGNPGSSSLRYETELGLAKPGTDLVINGHAYAPGVKPTTSMYASLQLDSQQQRWLIFGDRCWERSFWGVAISPPDPFTKMPMRYERCFGGDENNPLGVGYAAADDQLVGTPLPNIEDPNCQISHFRDRPQFAGCGYICRNWRARRQFAGTYDQKWQDERMPLYPSDFDERFLMAAHPQLRYVPHLRGGESVTLHGLTPEGTLSFLLPRIALSFRSHLANRWVPHQYRTRLTAVIIEPDLLRVMVVFQSFLPCDGQRFSLMETEIAEKLVLS